MIGIGAALQAGALASQYRGAETLSLRQTELFSQGAQAVIDPITKQIEQQRTVIDEYARHVNDLETKLGEAVNTIYNLTVRLNAIPQLLGDPSRSAGGPIGRVTEGDTEVLGLMSATGDLRWSANMSDIPPPGWQVADGRELSIEAYPELFSIIGQRFGPAADPNQYFSLPEPADVTQDADTLGLVNNGKLRLLIRT